MSHVTLIGGKISNLFGFQELFLKHGFNEAGFDSEFNLFASNHICPSFWQEKINWQSLEDTQVGYISQKCTLDKYTLEKYT